MAALRGSLSKPLLSAVRSAAVKRSPPTTSTASVRSTLLSSSAPSHHRSLPFPSLRSVGVLGGAMSLLPLHSAVAAVRLNSQLPVNSRACCGLSKGTFLKDP